MQSRVLCIPSKVTHVAQRLCAFRTNQKKRRFFLLQNLDMNIQRKELDVSISKKAINTKEIEFTNTKEGEAKNTIHYALSPLGIWKLRICQNDDLSCHFIKLELFQMKIFRCYLLCSFTFNSYLGTSWKQSPAAVKLPVNQLQFKQAADRMWINLRGPVDQSH